MLRGERADVTDFFLMTLMDTSVVKHNMLKGERPQLTNSGVKLLLLYNMVTIITKNGIITLKIVLETFGYNPVCRIAHPAIV